MNPQQTNDTNREFVNEVIHAFSESGFSISVASTTAAYGPVGDYAGLAARIRALAA